MRDYAPPVNSSEFLVHSYNTYNTSCFRTDDKVHKPSVEPV